ncbi:MAG: hypothetical protein O2944_08035 [Proteobacteria bacterium]|nr:hypothetical protein [Pseudomonadota bacterium]
MSGLHQLTMSYTAEQDRILFRIATTDKTEYRLWLTRRFVHMLWGALRQTFENDAELKRVVDKEVKDAILGMQHQEAVQKTDFTTPPVADTTNPGPLLVTGGTVNPGPELTAIKFKTSEGTDVRFNLNKQLMHAFCHLLVSTSLRAEWKLDLSMGDANVVVPQGEMRIH